MRSRPAVVPAAGALRHRHHERAVARRSVLHGHARAAAAGSRARRADRRVHPGRAGSLPELLCPLRGLEGHRRDPHALLQRRYPGHRVGRARRYRRRDEPDRRPPRRPAHPVPRRGLGRHRHCEADRGGTADQGPVGRTGTRAHPALRCERPHRGIAHRPHRRAEAVGARRQADESPARRDRALQADHPDRRVDQGRRLHKGHRRGDGSAQRAARDLCAVEPDDKGRMHGGTGLHVVAGPRAVRRWRAVPGVRDGRPHVPARPDEQLLHLPRDRAGDLRVPSDTAQRRVLHRRRACHGGPGQPVAAGQGDAVPEPGAHPGDGDHDGQPHRRVHV